MTFFFDGDGGGHRGYSTIDAEGSAAAQLAPLLKLTCSSGNWVSGAAERGAARHLASERVQSFFWL